MDGLYSGNRSRHSRGGSIDLSHSKSVPSSQVREGRICDHRQRRFHARARHSVARSQVVLCIADISLYAFGRIKGVIIRTFSEVVNGYIFEFLLFLHNEILLVDLYDQCGATCAASSKTEFPEVIFKFLRNIYCS